MRVFRESLSTGVFLFPCCIEGGMWDLIILFPDHCLSIYFFIIVAIPCTFSDICLFSVSHISARCKLYSDQIMFVPLLLGMTGFAH